MSLRNGILAVFLATVSLCIINVPSSHAEENRAKIRPTGLHLDVGAVFPENANTGALIGATLEMGSIIKPWMHLSLSGSRWSTDVSRMAFGSTVEGSVRDFRLATTVKLRLVEVSRVRPYVGLGLALHFVNSDVPSDRSLEDAIDGTKVGSELSLGIATTAGSLVLGAEGRREFVDDVKNWTFAFSVGTRWSGAKPTAPDTNPR